MNAATTGIHHIGLTVSDVQATADFFVSVLGWTQDGFDDSYPKTAVTDGVCRLTLWGARSQPSPFDRHVNVGLHHLALHVPTEIALKEVALAIAKWRGAEIEFMPELMGGGPRKHMMFVLHGGPRIELTWPGPQS